MPKERKSLFKTNFDFEEDNYDRANNNSENHDYHKSFTKKATQIKKEFDYEEDPYEPEKS